MSVSTLAILTGPTATGKTAIALEFASRHPEIEIVNADSMLVYRGMDIGTAKPTGRERLGIPHHLIDIRNPDEAFTAGDFHRETTRAIQDIQRRGKRALIVGGTGFYLKALLYGLWEAPKADPALRAELEHLENQKLFEELNKHDPASALRIGPNDRYRLIRAVELIRMTGKTPTELQRSTPSAPDPRFRLLIIDRKNESLYERISKRARAMLDSGLIEEVEKLQTHYPGARSLSAVGYAEVIRYREGIAPSGRKMRAGIKGLQDEIELATRQLVKRQRTWFRGQKLGQWFLLDQDREKLLTELETIYVS